MSHDVKADLRAAAAAIYRGSQPKLLLSQILIDRMAQGQNGQLMVAQVDSSTACSMVGISEYDLLQLLRGDPCFMAYQSAFIPRQLCISLDYRALQRAVRGSGQGHSTPEFAAPPAVAPYVQYNGMHGVQQHQQQQYAQHVYHNPSQPQAPHPPPQYQQQHMQPHPQYQQQYMAPPPAPQQLYNPYAPPAGPYPPDPGVQMQAPPPPPPPHMQPNALGPNGSSAGGGAHQSTPGLASSRGSSRSSSQTGGPSNSGMAGGQMGSQPSSAGGQMSLQPNQMDGQMGVQPNQTKGPISFGAMVHAHMQQQSQQAAIGVNAPAQVAAGAPQDSLASPGSGAESSNNSNEAPNAGRALLAKLQHQGDPGNSSSSSTAPPAPTAAAGPPGSTAGAGSAAAASSSGSSSRTPAAGPQGGAAAFIDPKGVYLRGIPVETTMQQLHALFADVGSIRSVDLIGVSSKRPGATRAAFVNFNEEASAQQLLSRKFVTVGDRSAQVLPKTKGRVQQNTQSQQAEASSSQAPAAAAGPGGKQNPRLLGRNEEGLPQLRGAACCPFYMGTGQCAFRNACKYHHPTHALHPECVAAGKNPHRYTGDMPSYARLMNFTERLWDYGSCVEAQLKIWLARHLIASENSGCGMFDESAAVPAAPEYHLYPDDSQPLGPYSCTMEEADQVLQLLWKAQPDEAAKQPMPYQGRVNVLLGDDPYYEMGPESQGKRSWVQLRVGNIKGLLNF